MKCSWEQRGWRNISCGELRASDLPELLRGARHNPCSQGADPEQGGSGPGAGPEQGWSIPAPPGAHGGGAGGPAAGGTWAGAGRAAGGAAEPGSRAPPGNPGRSSRGGPGKRVHLFIASVQGSPVERQRQH